MIPKLKLEEPKIYFHQVRKTVVLYVAETASLAAAVWVVVAAARHAWGF